MCSTVNSSVKCDVIRLSPGLCVVISAGCMDQRGGRLVRASGVNWSQVCAPVACIPSLSRVRCHYSLCIVFNLIITVHCNCSALSNPTTRVDDESYWWQLFKSASEKAYVRGLAQASVWCEGRLTGALELGAGVIRYLCSPSLHR